MTVATKFGEHWDFDRAQSYTDHQYSALSRSLGRSLERLGAIDILQLHKTTPEAHAVGIAEIGPSVSDPQSARMACESNRFQMISLVVRRGVVLSGTISPAHLAENLSAFRTVQSMHAAS